MVVACGQNEIKLGAVLQDVALDCTPFALDRFWHTCRAAAAASAQWFEERYGIASCPVPVWSGTQDRPWAPPRRTVQDPVTMMMMMIDLSQKKLETHTPFFSTYRPKEYDVNPGVR